MKEIKFLCPSCGQRIQFEPGHAGENVPCPSCATMIRLPLTAEPIESTEVENDASLFSSPGGEKVSYAPIPATVGLKDEAETNQVIANKPQKSSASPASTMSNPERNHTAAEVHEIDLHCACPMCQSRLHISIREDSSPIGLQASHHGSPPEHLSIAEREKLIENARKAHPVMSPNAQLKPRLDKILGG
jgi:hypothetical protein